MANDERNYYVICDDNCRFIGMTKEQIMAAIAEATGATPVHIDDAFITKIKEQNHQNPLKFWVGTEAEFNAISPKPNANNFIMRFDGEKVYVIKDLYDQPKKVNITIPLLWTGSVSPFTQVITIQGATITANTQVDLQPDADTLGLLMDSNTSALYIENDEGVLTAYAIGEKPTSSLTIQATIQEVQ